MANQKNITIVTQLADKLNRAKSVVVTDYRGLTHKQMEELHKNLKKIEAEFVVAKNSLLRIASASTNYELQAADLAGPSAVLLAYADEILPLKELAKVIKSLNLPKIKFGFIGKTRYLDTEIEAIAKLPGQEVLRGQVVSGLASPISNLVYSLNFNIAKLAVTIEEIRKKR